MVFYNLIANKPVQALGNINMPHSLIYIRDFARGLVMLGEKERALGEIWHIPCDQPSSIRELTGMIAALLGKTPKYRVANKMILDLMGLFSAEMREFQEIFFTSITSRSWWMTLNTEMRSALTSLRTRKRSELRSTGI